MALKRKQKELSEEYGIKQSRLREVWKRLRRNKLSMGCMYVVIALILLAALAGILFGDSYKTIDPINKLQGLSWKHLLGTDALGRDMLARIAYGARTSLLIAVISVSAACFFGTLLGVSAGYFGGVYENIIMRLADIFLAIPGFLMAMCIATALGSGPIKTAIAISIGNIPSLARVSRASVLATKDMQYVEAAKTIGSSNMRIMFKHLLPNILTPLLVEAALRIGGSIMAISGLSFIGLGVTPPTPEWGSMLSDGMDLIQLYPRLIIVPLAFIVITIFSFNLFADGLRDALDPRLKR